LSESWICAIPSVYRREAGADHVAGSPLIVGKESKRSSLQCKLPPRIQTDERTFPVSSVNFLLGIRQVNVPSRIQCKQKLLLDSSSEFVFLNPSSTHTTTVIRVHRTHIHQSQLSSYVSLLFHSVALQTSCKRFAFSLARVRELPLTGK
jgi:hypothetical protein